MALIATPVFLISRAVYDAMEKQHPIEHAGWTKWIREGKASIVEDD